MFARERCALVVALACGAGCGTLTNYQTAEPLGAATWQGSLALGVASYKDTIEDARTPSGHVELAVRRGISADTDVGLKVYLAGTEVSVLHAIHRACAWTIAVVGAIGGVRLRGHEVADGVQIEARGLLIATRRTSSRWAWSFGPELTGTRYWFDGGGHDSGLLVGAFANAEWRFASRWRLIPELSLHGTITGDVPVHGYVVLAGAALARTF